MNKYLSRATSSARSKPFNPLIWPFLFATFVYGIGFAVVLPFTTFGGASSLYSTMTKVYSNAPIIWGWVALATIVGGITFLLFNIPPFGKISGLIGFMLWLFGAICYGIEGNWIVLLCVTVPNMWFWFWQYLSLSSFRREDAADRRTMRRYDSGGYDDEQHPEQGKIDREDNRGVDVQ